MKHTLGIVVAPVSGRVFGTLVALALLLVGPTRAWAQEPASTPTPPPEASPPQEEPQEPPTGLPGLPNVGTWAFNLDLGLGVFGFANSLYTNVRPDPSGNLSDNWVESFAKAGVTGSFDLGGSALYAGASVVGERTFAAPPSLVGEDASSFQIEDLYVGWRSGEPESSDSLLDFTVGRAQYTVGHGMLVWDGSGEGGSRGAFWSNARKAWQLAAIARVTPGNHTIEAFYLDKDETPEAETGTKLWGANYEYAVGEDSTFGVSYFKFYADPEILIERDQMNVFNARAYTAPIPSLPGLAFEVEYAYEQTDDLLKSNAYNFKGGYEISRVAWSPTISYRYAYFEGDDPATPTDEAFDMLLPGFYDWGTWWQGEIAGEYFLANSNNISHQVRLHMTPVDSLGWGVFFYQFYLDKLPGPEITSKNVAFEIDGYADWEINDHFLLSLVVAWADPQEFVEQAYDRTDDFAYGMAYLTYSY